MTAFFARIGQAFRSLPTTGTTVAVVLSGVLALAIAGPLVYRALDDDGGGGGDPTTAVGPEPGGNQGNGNGNGGNADNGSGQPDGTPGTIVIGGGGGGSGAGSSSGSGGGGTAISEPGGSAGGETPPPTSPGPPTEPPPTTSPTTNPPVQPAPELLVSKEPNRAGAIPLDGAVLTGVSFPFLVDANGATDRVDFFWDDPDMKSAPFSTDPDPEFDFCGTDIAGLAIPLNTIVLPNGSHTVTAKVTGLAGQTLVLSAKVEIRNVVPTTKPPLCGSPQSE